MTHEELVDRTLARFRVRRGKPNTPLVAEAIRFAIAEAKAEMRHG